ncbi:MAG: hypothetical protein ACT6FC_06975 [Methanosarcinaceae archaeon]
MSDLLSTLFNSFVLPSANPTLHFRINVMNGIDETTDIPNIRTYELSAAMSI